MSGKRQAGQARACKMIASPGGFAVAELAIFIIGLVLNRRALICSYQPKKLFNCLPPTTSSFTGVPGKKYPLFNTPGRQSHLSYRQCRFSADERDRINSGKIQH